MFKNNFFVVVFTYFFLSYAYADSLTDGINAYEDNRDQEAFEHFKQSYLENNNNLIARAFLQLFDQAHSKDLPKDIRKKSFYDSKTILGSFINTHFILPAKNFRSMNQEEEKYKQLVHQKQTKEKDKKYAKEVKKLEKSLKKQSEAINIKINALKNLCNDGSQRAFAVLRKDFLKHKPLYVSNPKDAIILNNFFIRLASRYTILIDLNILQKIFPGIRNNYASLQNEALDLIYNFLLFFEAGHGSIDAIEEMTSIPADKLSLFFQYLLSVNPKYSFLVEVIQKMISFYLENKEFIDNKEDLYIKLSNYYTIEENFLACMPKEKRPLSVHFNIIVMQYLSCLGNIKALEWISNNSFFNKNCIEASFFAEMGYNLGNLKCGLILSSCLRHQKIFNNLKSLYNSLIDKCTNKEDAEFLTNEIAQYYSLDILSSKKFNLIDSSFDEHFEKIIKLCNLYQLESYTKVLQSSIGTGITYFLYTNDSAYCYKTFERALILYDIDPSPMNLFILCQILSNRDWPYAIPNERYIQAQKYLKLFLKNEGLVNKGFIINLTETKSIFAAELANIYIEEQKYKKAACYLKKSIGFGKKKSIITYITLCVFYLYDYNYDEMKEMLLALLKTNPSEKDLKNGYFLLGFIELLNANFVEANHCFDIAIQHGSKDAILNRSITQKIMEHQKIIEHMTSIDTPTPVIEPIVDAHDHSSSSSTEIILSDNEEKGFDEHSDDFIDETITTLNHIDLPQTPSNPLSLSSEIAAIDLEPWKQFPSKKSKPKRNYIPQDPIEPQESKQKKIKIDKLVAELQDRKLNKRKMTRYLSRLLNLVDKEAYITPGEAVRVKFNVGDTVLPMHIQHPSAGNKVEAGRLKTIQTFVDALIS